MQSTNSEYGSPYLGYLRYCVVFINDAVLSGLFSQVSVK